MSHSLLIETDGGPRGTRIVIDGVPEADVRGFEFKMDQKRGCFVIDRWDGPREVIFDFEYVPVVGPDS